MGDVFISYKRQDRAVAAALAEELTAAGYSCWWDTSLVAGEHFNEAIQRHLDEASCVLVIWSRESSASKWVQAEAVTAFNRDALVAARLDDVELKYPFHIVQTADLRRYSPGRSHPGLAEVVRGVAAKVGREPRAALSATEPPRRVERDAPPETKSKLNGAIIAGVAAGLLILAFGVYATTGGLSAKQDEVATVQAPASEASAPTSDAATRITDDVAQQPVVQREEARESAPQTSPPPIVRSAPSGSFDDCDGASWCPPMLTIAGGEFVMGSPSGDPNRASNEGPQRQVRVGPFAIGRHEVTFDQWEACAAAGGCDLNAQPEDQGWGRGRRPVINVSWNDAQQYTRWLSTRTGRAYRLPTEAEWEFAARAGTQTRYSTGDGISAAQARFGAPSTSSVGQFPPNALGLYDFHGNAWEWVQDCFENSLASVPLDGSAFEGGRCVRRVLRGGSWDNAARSIRSAVRYGGDPNVRGAVRGFRVAADVR